MWPCLIPSASAGPTVLWYSAETGEFANELQRFYLSYFKYIKYISRSRRFTLRLSPVKMLGTRSYQRGEISRKIHTEQVARRDIALPGYTAANGARGAAVDRSDLFVLADGHAFAPGGNELCRAAG